MIDFPSHKILQRPRMCLSPYDGWFFVDGILVVGGFVFLSLAGTYSEGDGGSGLEDYWRKL